jgi:MFS family permease
MGNMMGYFNLAMSVGMIVGPVAAGWVMDFFGLSMTFVFGGIVGLLGSGACLYWLFIKSGVRFHANL